MESFYSRLFIDIQKRIAEKLPEWKHIDQNFGQYAFNDFRPEAYDKSLLVDFPDTQYSELGDIGLHGVATISILQLMAPFSQSYNLAPEQVREKALEYYEMEERLVRCLQGWAPGYCTPLALINQKGHNRNEVSMRIREMVFTTAFERMMEEEEKEITFNFKGSIN